jgi:DNA-nicking Smr family endonuclease
MPRPPSPPATATATALALARAKAERAEAARAAEAAAAERAAAERAEAGAGARREAEAAAAPEAAAPPAPRMADVLPPEAPRPVVAPADADDAALFREAIGEVRVIEAAPAPAPRAPPPAPRARQRERDEAEALQEAQAVSLFALMIAGDQVLEHRRDDVGEQVLRRLARGEFAVEAEIDLHGHDLLGAEAALRAFLHAARREGRRCVRVIHGRGSRSPDGQAVLKALTDRMLAQRGDILAYASAPPAMGGTGAVLALIARR